MVENLASANHAAASQLVHFSEQLTTLSRLVREGLAERLESHALGWIQFSLLWVCHESAGDGIAQNELSALLGVSSAHVSGLVEQLRCRGWITGHRAAEDRRRQLWKLTRKGRALLDAALADMADWADGRQWHLSVDEVQFLDRIVQRLTRVNPASHGDAGDIAPKKGAA
jgi:DNA-binding MarR family transcriptional regulator